MSGTLKGQFEIDFDNGFVLLFVKNKVMIMTKEIFRKLTEKHRADKWIVEKWKRKKVYFNLYSMKFAQCMGTNTEVEHTGNVKFYDAQEISRNLAHEYMFDDRYNEELVSLRLALRKCALNIRRKVFQTVIQKDIRIMLSENMKFEKNLKRKFSDYDEVNLILYYYLKLRIL